MPLYGGDVKALRKAEDAPFALPLAKRILLHLVRALAHAHSRNVIHTDIKKDNIFFTTSLSSADIERLLAEDPSRYHAPENSLEGQVQAAVSQPLPVISRDDALRATFLLADFGLSQPVLLHPPCTITAAPLRAPEVFLGAHWDAPADIWSLGVLAYDLITSHGLFKYQVNSKWDLTEDENMLYQMMCLTGEDFEPPQLQASPLAPEFFTAQCEPSCVLLKKKPQLVHFLFDNSVPAYGNVDKADVPAIASFLRRCLRLDPHKRATAQDLLSDPLFADVP
ncbi:kinase-like protein [Auricularia subglabra TFB-10046 SS5]|nr:kinase-like protein [Auricularia subglabra TFB-10046 SS5]